MAPQIYEPNATVTVNRMRNYLSKPREPNNENLTGYLQRYVLLECEKEQNTLFFTANNAAF
jgi:hypothetical protein